LLSPARFARLSDGECRLTARACLINDRFPILRAGAIRNPDARSPRQRERPQPRRFASASDCHEGGWSSIACITSPRAGRPVLAKLRPPGSSVVHLGRLRYSSDEGEESLPTRRECSLRVKGGVSAPIAVTTASDDLRASPAPPVPFPQLPTEAIVIRACAPAFLQPESTLEVRLALSVSRTGRSKCLF
jgi:hypothetical protein